MSTLLIVGLCLLVAVVSAAAVVVVSLRRGGPIARLIAARALKSKRVQAAMTSDQALDMLDSNPDLVEQALAAHANDPATRAAAQQFRALPRSQRDALLRAGLAQAQESGALDDPQAALAELQAVQRPRTQGQARAAAKRKQAARSRRKAAKKSRR